ncbi:hypothetical protein BDV96DRAFT_276030 [Lophiotrema nucula]|uniref:Uncharacterized protein n=1 Tax=Lophiotrema nucula TaxID=690887 RepID=A0A6A5ZMB0_9PLEO|nr:hypothetical protein BDV96DRAFT_276030 [Lophiotrema nucula]
MGQRSSRAGLKSGNEPCVDWSSPRLTLMTEQWCQMVRKSPNFKISHGNCDRNCLRWVQWLMAFSSSNHSASNGLERCKLQVFATTTGPRPAATQRMVGGACTNIACFRLELFIYAPALGGLGKCTLKLSRVCRRPLGYRELLVSNTPRICNLRSPSSPFLLAPFSRSTER